MTKIITAIVSLSLNIKTFIFPHIYKVNIFDILMIFYDI